VLSFETGLRLQDIDPDEAWALCDARLAYREIEPDRKSIAAITLMVSDDQFREATRARRVPKGRPKPRAGIKAASSTGGGDQGLGPLIGRHRVLHYDAAGRRGTGYAECPRPQ
jgi:hypothetical protein